ncbi:MAG: hypothetical protein DVB25_04030 [Verrucomicrobia bacterium]|nr:MAG: hypothetical protein DVB25_04030 [Verrucomicrobiota bacterium]
MKITAYKREACGYVSLLLVLSMGILLTLLMVFAYRKATTALAVQSSVQLQVDYSEKGEAILRSIVAITPNRAIRAMQPLSNANTTNSNTLRWENIFTDALAAANAQHAISTQVLTALGVASPVVANSGDATLDNPSLIFKALGTDTGLISAGINHSLGSGYPVPLSCNDATDTPRDLIWPIISTNKVYGTLAQSGVALPVGTYPFNILTYPNINFGYARPGQPFVAKRNWWGFSMNLAGPNAAATASTMQRREFVLSIYEIPSQLPISAASFLEVGQYAGGAPWGDVTISGGIFAGRAQVDGSTALLALATRRGATLSTSTTVGGQSFTGDPFAPGLREIYQLTQGDFFPVSLASESGRAAFIPINRGADYFDRFAHVSETAVLSATTWDNYSLGAMQCAMRLDITQALSATNHTPAVLRFSYLKAGIRQDLGLPLTTGLASGLPAGYILACGEGQTYNFGTAVVDLAYGSGAHFGFQTAMTGSITFNNARFGDPLPGVIKTGYFKPSYPFEVKNLASGKICIAVYPTRCAAFLAALQADSTAANNSLVVNVDYSAATGSAFLTKPLIPCSELDYGVILQECANLTSFSKGFSLVTNLRLYFGDDFNTTAATPPSGYTPAGLYYPPCSIFTPERRYGVEIDPVGVNFSGQVGSVASETAAVPVRPLDTKMLSGASMTANQIHVDLRPITHPAELPPIFMMNWLVLLEERRREFYSGN